MTGSGLLSGSVVYFGGRAAATTITSSTSITAVAPAGSGAVDVTVQTLVGRSRVVAAERFTYVGPTVTGLSTPTGLAVGGQTVKVTGWNLGGATAVWLGRAKARFTIETPERLSATTPAGSGTVAVTVTTAQGTSPAVTVGRFTYVAKPIITSISPQTGPLTVGNPVTTTGSNLSGVSKVMFDGPAVLARGLIVVVGRSPYLTEPAQRSALACLRTFIRDT